MIIKYIVLFVTFSFVYTTKLVAQVANLAASDKMQNGYSLLRDWHLQNRAELKGLDSTYECYVTFKVDTSGNVIDLAIIEIRICKLPEVLKKYITKVFMSANGKWGSEMKDGHKVVSGEKIWHIISEKINQSFSESMKASEKFLYYHAFSKEYDAIAEKFYYLGTEGKSLALNYYGSNDPCRGDSKQQQ